ncbi:MAG TPA: precorrin-6y C5,15-methyltransferase (decarboxylating) subunit CbiE [Alphaproteobacteria bacterium]|nr:precorrin-6y C5,15-methyltransferase (decarboxylating) subunit CbiE [Alphaproteobacteria bacterium]
MNQAPWLSVIGLGEDGIGGLSSAAQALLGAAEIVVGGERHLAMLPASVAVERLAWATPLTATMDAIEARRGRRVVVLATGDPMWYGVGVTLTRRFAREEMAIIPSISAFTLAASRLGWPLAEVETLTLHGRPIEMLALYLRPGARLLVLSENGDTPAAVARFLRERGWGFSGVIVLERLGGASERIVEGVAGAWTHPRAADLNTLGIICEAGPEARVLSRAPGLPDDAFAHDGQITKREIRAITLAALAPSSDQTLWDVGAGCGSIAIEWMRAGAPARAIAVERHKGRLALIAKNASALGVPRIAVVDGEAPAALAGLPPPDAVFIGGGVTASGLVETCWHALRSAGRMVANAVTLEGEAALVAWRGRLGGQLTRIAISRAEPIGGLSGWRPLMPVTQWTATKP